MLTRKQLHRVSYLACSHLLTQKKGGLLWLIVVMDARVEVGVEVVHVRGEHIMFLAVV